MAAIITDDFRKNLAARLIDEIADTGASSPNYYIGIGKSDPWTDAAADEAVAGFAPSVPDGSIREKEEVKENLMALIEVNRHSRVIPRIEFQQNQTYKRYDASDPTCFIPTVVGADTLQPCYAVYNDKIWVCLRNKTDASNVNGQNTTANDIPQVGNNNDYELSGGGSGTHYLWAYVADVIPATTGFNTSQFIEVSTSNITAAQTADETTGVIYGIKLLNGGAGYTNAAVVKIVGTKADGSHDEIGGNSGSNPGGANIDVTIQGGVIQDIDIVGDTLGIDFIHASLVITDPSATTQAEGVVLVGPPNGFGYNVAKDLPSYYVGLEASLQGNLEGDGPVIPYRQVSLLRGVESVVRSDDGDTDGTLYDAEETLDTLRYFDCSSSISSAGVTPGDIVEVLITSEQSARGFVDYVDATNDRIYFHQNNNDLVNLKAFPAADTVKVLDRETGTEIFNVGYSAIEDAEYNRTTGEIIFYENRIQVTRSTQQTEDIKLVIQL